MLDNDFRENVTERYEYSRKPRRCPVCKAATIATILFGLPGGSAKLFADLDAGKIVLGGCCVTDDDPVWQCTACHTEIYRKRQAAQDSRENH